MDEDFEREVRPYNPDSWIDHTKDKIGYEIPFTRTFYEHKILEPADEIAIKIEEHERILNEKFDMLFERKGK